MFVDIFTASADGQFNKTSPLLERLLGRQPQDISNIINEQ